MGVRERSRQGTQPGSQDTLCRPLETRRKAKRGRRERAERESQSWRKRERRREAETKIKQKKTKQTRATKSAREAFKIPRR